MEYIRHREYGDKSWDNQLGWWFLIGAFDTGFVAYANDRGMQIMKQFKDPYTGYELHTEHLMATANGHLLKPPPANLRSAGGGDVAGWAGDLMTFFADWRSSLEEYPSGRAFCAAKLAKPGIESSFGFNDLVEDADGFLIARAVRSGKTIVQALTHHYNGGGGLHRFRDFFQGRWGSAETCRYAAHDALTGTDATLGLRRKQLIMLKGVMLPAVLQNTPGGYDKLSEFEQGFVDTLLARVGMERQAAARYEANHRAYLREAAGRARGR